MAAKSTGLILCVALGPGRILLRNMARSLDMVRTIAEEIKYIWDSESVVRVPGCMENLSADMTR